MEEKKEGSTKRINSTTILQRYSPENSTSGEIHTGNLFEI